MDERTQALQPFRLATGVDLGRANKELECCPLRGEERHPRWIADERIATQVDALDRFPDRAEERFASERLRLALPKHAIGSLT